MSGRTERILTMIMGLVLAIGAVIWIMVTQTRSDIPGVRTPTRMPGPAPSLTAENSQGAIAPAPTSDLTYFLIRYQAFENGFMMQRIGEACVYAYNTTTEDEGIVLSPVLVEDQPREFTYCIPFDGLFDTPLPEPANALLEADTPFRLIWAVYAPIRDALGQPTAERIDSQSALLPTPTLTDDGVSYTPIAYLPDGRLLECGSLAATAGQCRISS